jgi:16S rRNA (cytosine967-C5)-methyltransferase
MAANNRAPEAAIRANTLKVTPDALQQDLPVQSHRAEGLPDALVLDEPFDAHGSRQYANGAFAPQSRAAQAVSIVLDPQPGDQVLDMCAAPGGKTTHIAALMHNEGRVLAVEKDPTRAKHLRTTVDRLAATNVEVREADAAAFTGEEAFDRVLVDPPCSDLGTLALRPDARWRKHPGDVTRLARLQRKILDAGAAALKPGGTLVYSTCTISPPENEELVNAFLTDRGDFEIVPARSSDLPVWDHPTVPAVLQTFPHRDGTDGFFIARLRRVN